MPRSTAKSAKVTVNEKITVSALIQVPAKSRALYVFAHGAGAGMEHAFMAAFSSELAARGIGTLRFNFPYLDQGSRRPDPPALCHATIRAAVALARRRWPRLKIIAGGKSFGGRMTSQAQADEPLVGVSGLAFVGFPLHPPTQPSTKRADHLKDVQVPMLFLQGTRDDLADLKKLKPVIRKLGKRATLKLCQEADHGFHVLKRSGRTNDEVMSELADAFVAWADAI